MSPVSALPRRQLGISLVIDLRVGQAGLVLVELCPGNGEVRLILIDHRLIGARIDLCTDLTLFDLGVVIAEQLLNDARDVGADD